MKRLLSVLLVICMIATTLSAQVFVSYAYTASSADVKKDEIPEISSSLVENVEIINANDHAYYKFTPAETAAYKYYSKGQYNIYGAIRNETFRLIAEGDNYVTDFYYPQISGDFSIIRNFQAGETYYLESCISTSATGSYIIGLEKVPRATSVEVDYIGYRQYGSEITFSAKFTPEDCEPEAVRWTSSNPEIIQVDTYGNAVCKGIGTATITVTTENGLTASREFVITDCNEIKVNEKKEFMVLFETDSRYKLVPETTGIYTFSFSRGNWVYFLAATLYDSKWNKITSMSSSEEVFESTLKAGEAYYLEIDSYSGDVMTDASVLVELKEEVQELEPSETAVPEETSTPVPMETEFPRITETPAPTDTICPTETPEPLHTPTINATEPTLTETIPVPWEAIGDVDVDGDIDAEDALLVLKHAAKLEALEGQSLEVADTNQDECADAEDALKILKYAADLIVEF